MKVKTPEQMAEERAAQIQWMPKFWCVEDMRKSTKEDFLAGYSARDEEIKGLVKYAAHYSNCRMHRMDQTCTCGLDEILKLLRERGVK